MHDITPPIKDCLELLGTALKMVLTVGTICGVYFAFEFFGNGADPLKLIFSGIAFFCCCFAIGKINEIEGKLNWLLRSSENQKPV